jgi:penicillin G amidase
LVWENLSDYEKTILEQYTKGVNEGLASLKTRPPEYWLLKVKPQPWLPEDSILVIFTFYLDLQNNPDLDYARWVARKTLPEEVVQFLDGNSHSWEAAIDGSQILKKEIPGREAFSYLKATPKDSALIEIPNAVERMPGSNNWVVGPEASVSGFPILAEDPHLNLGVPNTWYKMSYSYKLDGSDTILDIHGFSIPGLPGIAFGTNGRMAWGITNSSLDTDDLIILEPGENGFPEYKTPTGTAQIQQKQEIIEIKGAEPVTMEIEYTQWGPVVGETPSGEKRVRQWSAYDPDSANIRSMLIERFVTNEEFIENSYELNLPAQNYVLADDGGNIAWKLVPRNT